MTFVSLLHAEVDVVRSSHNQNHVRAQLMRLSTMKACPRIKQLSARLGSDITVAILNRCQSATHAPVRTNIPYSNVQPCSFSAPLFSSLLLSPSSARPLPLPPRDSPSTPLDTMPLRDPTPWSIRSWSRQSRKHTRPARDLASRSAWGGAFFAG